MWSMCSRAACLQLSTAEQAQQTRSDLQGSALLAPGSGSTRGHDDCKWLLSSNIFGMICVLRQLVHSKVSNQPGWDIVFPIPFLPSAESGALANLCV